MDALLSLGVIDAAARIARREISAAALLEATLARIGETDAQLRAWVSIDAAGARAAAVTVDRDMAAGRSPGPLAGVPIGIKDVLDVAGMPTTAGAARLAHRHPAVDAEAVARLRAAGAVIVGKTVATEFAFKDPAATLNPWSADHTPGGSSSGSAAAVSAGQVAAAIGTQTVGSILRPAAFCGVVGLKGAFGAVPVEGVVPLARSLDHVGPIGRSVADVALLEAVLEGRRIQAMSSAAPRLAVSTELLAIADDPSRDHLAQVFARLRTAGAVIDEIELPFSLPALFDAGRATLEIEAATWHEPLFQDHAADYGPQIAALVRAGLARPSRDLDDATRVRLACREAMADRLVGFDALLSPVAPGAAPLRSEGTGDFRLCAPWSYTGMPSIAIPSGLGDAGLPLAIQLTGTADALERLLGAAVWCEAVIGFDARPPGA